MEGVAAIKRSVGWCFSLKSGRAVDRVRIDFQPRSVAVFQVVAGADSPGSGEILTSTATVCSPPPTITPRIGDTSE